MEIKTEGHSFCKIFVASHKTEDDFLKSANEDGHKHWFEDDKNRSKKLKEIYRLSKYKD